MKNKPNPKLVKMIEEEFEKIKQELVDEIDDFFPKVRPEGINPGRGEAAVLTGIALAKFEKTAYQISEKWRKEGIEEILEELPREHLKGYRDSDGNHHDPERRRGFNEARWQIKQMLLEELKQKK